MSNEIKNYIRYFFKSNRRLLFLEFVIFFMLLPFSFNQTLMRSAVDMETRNAALLGVVGGTSVLCAMMAAFVMPIYVYRFIFKRSSSDLYFALPIKRGTLYTVQFFLGALLALIPLYANFLINFILLCLNTSVSIGNVLLFYGVLLILFLIMFSFISFLVMKCNNLLDAVLIPGAYLILPVFIVLTAVTFLDGQGSDFFIANVNVATEMIDLEFFASMLSLPVVMIYSVIFLALRSAWYSNVVLLLIFLYWLAIGMGCFYFGRKSFMQRKEEEAQQRSTSFATYPFLIAVFTVCMMMLVFSYDTGSKSMLMTMFTILILYIVMHMFAKRTLRLKLKDFAAFIIIFLCALGFSGLFHQTKGFGLLHEVPQMHDVAFVELNYHLQPFANTEEGTESLPNQVKFNKNTYKSNEELYQIREVQQYMIDQIKKGKDHDEDAQYEAYFSIYYHMKSGKIYTRSYHLSPSLFKNVMLQLNEDTRLTT